MKYAFWGVKGRREGVNVASAKMKQEKTLRRKMKRKKGTIERKFKYMGRKA